MLKIKTKQGTIINNGNLTNANKNNDDAQVKTKSSQGQRDL